MINLTETEIYDIDTIASWHDNDMNMIWIICTYYDYVSFWVANVVSAE